MKSLTRAALVTLTLALAAPAQASLPTLQLPTLTYPEPKPDISTQGCVKLPTPDVCMNR